MSQDLYDNIRGTTEVKSCENLKADIVKLNRVLKETALKAVTDSEEGVEAGMSEGLKYINEMMPKIMLSEDVKALYPSIKRDRAGIVTRKAMEDTTVSFMNVDYKMALRYISKSSKPEQIREWNLSKYCPVRTKRKGVRPGMTGDDIEDDKWTEGVIPYDTKERKRILGRVMAIAVDKVFTSNAYTFAGTIRIQADGAPIGLDLSGEIGRLEMGDWDDKMAELCESNLIQVDLTDRYVDDVDTMLGAIPHG